jgi:hypothetical protein
MHFSSLLLHASPNFIIVITFDNDLYFLHRVVCNIIKVLDILNKIYIATF